MTTLTRKPLVSQPQIYSSSLRSIWYTSRVLYVCVLQLTWLNPTESQYNIQWDDQMCPGGSKKLFAKAYKEALIPQEQEQLIAEFKSDVKLVYHVGLTPQKVCMHTHYSCSPLSESKAWDGGGGMRISGGVCVYIKAIGSTPTTH